MRVDLEKAIEKLCRDRGFERSRGLVFLRGRPGSVNRISFSESRGHTGSERVTCGVGVRFPEIEAVRRGGVEREGDTPTVGVPLHFLRRPRAYFDWIVPTSGECSDIVGSVESALDELALPFFDSLRSMEDLRRSLEAQEPEAWFTLDPQGRQELLALLDAVEVGRSAAIARLEAELALRRDDLPKTRYRLERLLAHLRE